MSMIPSAHLFDVEVIVLRRVKTGEEDGTPIYTEDPDGIEWPDGVNRNAYIDFDEEEMTVTSGNKVGSVTTQRATLLMETEVYDIIKETDNLMIDGLGDKRWRIDSIVRPRSLWGGKQTQIKASRQKNA